MNRERLRNLALAGLFAALGVLLSGLSVPVGPTRCFPAQHALNALAGVLLGPWWAAGTATVTSLLRVSLGTGTLFAFPGSIPGALAVGFAAALLPDRLKPLGALAEPLATCTLGAWICAAWLGPAMGKSVGYAFLAGAFGASSVPGALLGLGLLAALRAGLPLLRGHRGTL